jgi:hypothetical protein
MLSGSLAHCTGIFDATSSITRRSSEVSVLSTTKFYVAQRHGKRRTL